MIMILLMYTFQDKLRKIKFLRDPSPRVIVMYNFAILWYFFILKLLLKTGFICV